jgi:hypothetical protein
MDYYLCNKATAPQLADTQENAKKLDKGFEKISVDTTKHPLMEMLNQMLKGEHELQVAPPLKVSHTELSDEELGDLLGAPKVVHVRPPNPRREKLVATSEDLTEVQSFIETLDDDQLYVLDRIAEHIAMRRAETPAVPAPPKRRRA